jgi:CheY-like chemotaxis protein
MGIRILTVEDDERIASSLVRGLREEGFAVEHAADGEAARRAPRSGGWDLVILDWWLPGEDGLGVLRRFRQTDRHTPVLFLTARDAVADRVRGLEGGAADTSANRSPSTSSWPASGRCSAARRDGAGRRAGLAAGPAAPAAGRAAAARQGAPRGRRA